MNELIKEFLIKENIDAWVIADYECKTPSLLSLIGKRFLTRKCFIVIPKIGKSFIIAHFIDKQYLLDLSSDYDLRIYKNWNEMTLLLKEGLLGYKKIMMDISENGLMPRVSSADYGTVCMIKEIVPEIVSSCDLLQHLSSVVKDDAWESEIRACSMCDKIKDEAFDFISKKFINKEEVTEYDVQQYIMERFKQEGMVTDEDIIVSVNGNAGNPHYAPTKELHSPIKEGDIVLIDMWAKYDEDCGVFGDITWVGVVGDKIPPKFQIIFDVVKNAVQIALDFLEKNIPVRDVYGYEVDRLVRDYIISEGYGDYFIHRTGHNICIDSSCHGSGVNLDDYETHDTRKIIDDISFSIEPGIYMEDMGVREEINVHIMERKVIVPTKIQKEIILIKTK